MRTKRIWMPLLAAVVATGLVSGCFAPVDEDADVYIRGTVLDLDGTPIEGQQIELYKSTAPFWVYGGDWLEHIFEIEDNTFRTAVTDSEGKFEIHMTGKDANTPSGNFAAYFAVVVFYDDSREMGILTEDHVFSNADLTWKLPEMQYWDVGSVVVDPDLYYMDFTWPELPKNPNRDFLLVVNDGDWAQWVDQDRTALTDLPVEVLNPDTTQCDWQMYARSTGLLYRSDRHPFTNENIFNPIAATASDGDGNELPGITDEEYTDRQYFHDATDPKSVVLDLRAQFEVTAFVIHHAWIYNWWTGAATISTSTDGIDWDVWRTVDGQHENWGLFYHYEIDMQGRVCRFIKIELTGGESVEFNYIGELVAFGSPL
jgi:hypothetical protein